MQVLPGLSQQAANAALHGMDSLIVAEGIVHFYLETSRVPHITADDG